MTPAHPQQKGAEALARRIEAHWAAQGHDVEVRLITPPEAVTHGMQPAPDSPDMSASISRHTREARDRARWGHGKYRGKA